MKKVKFGASTHVTVDRSGLAPTEACASQLAALPRATVDASCVVQEVLKAEIAEQTCGRVDASGRFVGLAEAEYARACAIPGYEKFSACDRNSPPLNPVGKRTREHGQHCQITRIFRSFRATAGTRPRKTVDQPVPGR